MTFGAVMLAVVLLVAAGASVLAGVFATQLHASDAAGNGLAQAYFVIVLLVAWAATGIGLATTWFGQPHERHGDGMPWGTFTAVACVLFGVAFAAQFPAMYLLTTRRLGVSSAVLQIVVAAVPLAFVAYAAWRMFALPVPQSLATWGCVALVIVGSALPIVVLIASPSRAAVAPAAPWQHRVVYPALLVQGTKGVRVVRAADELDVMVPAAFDAPDTRLIDSRGFAWERRGDADPSCPTSPMPFATIVGDLLAIPVLHDDPPEDARIRHLLEMQRDVTALTFVLPR
jgi:hypothetical protein